MITMRIGIKIIIRNMIRIRISIDSDRALDYRLYIFIMWL